MCLRILQKSVDTIHELSRHQVKARTKLNKEMNKTNQIQFLVHLNQSEA